MQHGGKTSDHLSSSVAEILKASAEFHKDILPDVHRFAREWLEENPEDEYAGSVYAALVFAGQCPDDVSMAKQWYEDPHHPNSNSWLILSSRLERQHREKAERDLWAIQRAKILLQNESFRTNKPRLVGNFLDVFVDEEIISWAKEVYTLRGSIGLLIRLLLRSSDEESIASAEQSVDRWKDSAVESAMLNALFTADPCNKVAAARARMWLEQNQKEDAYYEVIKSRITEGV